MAISKHKNTTCLIKCLREKRKKEKERVRVGRYRIITHGSVMRLDWSDDWRSWSVRGGRKSPQNTEFGGLIHSQVQVVVLKHSFVRAKFFDHVQFSGGRCEKWVWGHFRGPWQFMSSSKAAASCVSKPVWMWPSLGGQHVCKGGQFGMIKAWCCLPKICLLAASEPSL